MSGPDKTAEPARDQWPSRDWKDLSDEGRREREPPHPGPRAFASSKQARAGSAAGVGSVDYEQTGAFDVTAAAEATLGPQGIDDSEAMAAPDGPEGDPGADPPRRPNSEPSQGA